MRTTTESLKYYIHPDRYFTVEALIDNSWYCHSLYHHHFRTLRALGWELYDFTVVQ